MIPQPVHTMRGPECGNRDRVVKRASTFATWAFAKELARKLIARSRLVVPGDPTQKKMRALTSERQWLLV
jgi:hypothetical protein